MNESYADSIFWYYMLYNIGSKINNLPRKNIILSHRKNKKSYVPVNQPDDILIKLFYGYWVLFQYFINI